jgi:hypothetical protein
MYHRLTANFLLIVLLFAASVTGYAQVTGMVADSSTMLSLPNVNIRIKGRALLTASDSLGSFSILASDQDTLIFSMVGYYTKMYSASRVREVGIVYMTPEQKMLKPIVISATVLIPGLKKIPPESAWKNPTQDPKTMATPGLPTVQTFGPGYVFKGPISRFSKYEKERKKLKKVQADNNNARGYVEIVNSEEVKGKIMTDHSIDETEYYRLLAIFNEKNRDIIYELNDKELISSLFLFYAENVKKK